MTPVAAIRPSNAPSSDRSASARVDVTQRGSTTRSFRPCKNHLASPDIDRQIASPTATTTAPRGKQYETPTVPLARRACARPRRGRGVRCLTMTTTPRTTGTRRRAPSRACPTTRARSCGTDAYAGNIAKLEAVDELTVKFTLCNPDVALPSKVAFSAVGIFSTEQLDDDRPGAPIDNPIGTGPYKLEAWERGNQIVLTANEDYWGDPAAHADGGVPVGRGRPSAWSSSSRAASTASTTSAPRTSPRWRTTQPPAHRA